MHCFFRKYFPQIKLLTANGKSSVLKTLQSQCNSSVLVVYDSAAFGVYFSDLQKYIQKSSGVKVLDWESFEEYVLELPFIGCHLPEDTPCCFNGREVFAESQLKRYIDYDKSALSWCIDDTKSCSGCHHNDCSVSYSNSCRVRTSYVCGVLTTIEEGNISLNQLGAF